MSTQLPTPDRDISFLTDQIEAQYIRTPVARWAYWLAPVAVTGALLRGTMVVLGSALTSPLGVIAFAVIAGLGIWGSRAGIDALLRSRARRTPLALQIAPALARMEEFRSRTGNREEIVQTLRQEIAAAVHPERIEFAIYDPRTDRYGIDETGETLPLSSPLVTWALAQPPALPITLSAAPQSTILEPLVARGMHTLIPLGTPGWVALSKPHQGKVYSQSEQGFLQMLSHRAAVALQHAARVEAQEQRAQDLQALSWIAQAVTFTLEVDDLLELIYTQLKRVMRLPSFYIALKDPDGQQVSFSFYVENDERLSPRDVWPATEGLTGMLLKNNTTLRTDDYVEECRRRGCEPAGPHTGFAWMGTALTTGDRSIGVMVASASSKDLKFTQTEENIFVTVASHTAALLERHALQQRLESRARQLATLNEVSNLLASSLDLDEVLNLVVHHAASLLNCEAGSLLLLDEEVGDLVFRISSGPSGQSLIGKRIPAGRGIAGAAFSQNRPMISEDPQQDIRWYASVDARSDFVTQSVMAAPLNTRGRTTGVLEVLNRRGPQAFTDEDSELLLAFATHAAVAIENARLFTATDQALHARVEELTTLQYIDRQLNASLDPHAVMEHTLEWALRITGADTGVVSSLHADDDETGLRILAHKGYGEDLLAPYDEDKLWPVTQGLVGHTIELGRTVLVTDLEHDPHYCEIRPGMEAQLTVPIKREERVVGVIALESASAGRFGEEAVMAIERLADHAAVAIDNARLFDQLQQAVDAKTEFVSFVSHELKQPMTAIKGYADLLSRGVSGTLNDQQQQFVTIIRNNVQRMDRMVQDLLDISRIEAGRLKLEMASVDPVAMTQEAVAALAQEIAGKGQSLYLDIPECLPAIRGDRGRLIQILTNLLSNANKYTPAGGNIALRVELAENGDSPSLRWQVIDDGIGMNQDEVQQLFTKYYRSRNPAVRGVPGTGLGLVITRSIIEMHGGTIAVTSAPEAGSTFSFGVPLADLPQNGPM
jgi:signal transduction histidine kinase